MRKSRALHLIPLLLALAGGLGLASAQAQSPSPASGASSTSAIKLPTPVAAKKWSELTAAQQQALAPLQSQWDGIGVERQRKWLEISKNYASLPAAQQEAMQARMKEWAKMNPTERAQARLNFAEAKAASKTLTPEEKKAKWEAYQALSPEEKRRLAQSTPANKGAAPAVTPVPAKRLATVPTGGTATTAHHAPKIAVAPEQVNRQTLLPQPNPVAQPSSH